jgi:hypothetical protein
MIDEKRTNVQYSIRPRLIKNITSYRSVISVIINNYTRNRRYINNMVVDY